jgi:hypothetical protein
MLKGSVIVDDFVSTLQTVPALVTAMNNDPSRIVGFHFIPGKSKGLQEAIQQMLSPSILVNYEAIAGGNFSGYQIWKHHLDVYIRGANQAGQATPVNAEDIPYLMMNQPVNGGTLNIRFVSIMPGQLDIMDTPSFNHMVDDAGSDYWVGRCVFGEIGDQS